MTRYDYPVHPLAQLFPPLSPDEFKKLKNDIAAHGQQEPITLSQDGTFLLDGRHRLRACKELGVQPRIERFSHIAGPTRPTTEADFIWSKNLVRRHLTADQRAAIAMKWSDAEKEASRQRQLAALKKGEQTPVRADSPGRQSSDGHATRNALAQKAQTSPHKIRQAENVKKNAPDLLNKVAAGETKLRDAEKTAEARPQDGQPQRAQKYDYDPTAFAVDTTVKQIEKIIAGARSHISPSQPGLNIWRIVCAGRQLIQASTSRKDVSSERFHCRQNPETSTPSECKQPFTRRSCVGACKGAATDDGARNQLARCTGEA
jgi:hypothetical protein